MQTQNPFGLTKPYEDTFFRVARPSRLAIEYRASLKIPIKLFRQDFMFIQQKMKVRFAIFSWKQAAGFLLGGFLVVPKMRSEYSISNLVNLKSNTVVSAK